MAEAHFSALELPLGADLQSAVGDWLFHLRHERGLAAKTLEAYERDVRQFLGFLASHLGHQPCLADLERWSQRRSAAFWPRAAAPAR